MSLLDRIEGLVVPAWVRALIRAAPLIIFALVFAALAFERRMVVNVTGERDRIIRVIDPTGKLTPDKAIVAAQRVLTERDAAKKALTVTTGNYRLATARAQAADLLHARDVQQRDAAITGKAQHDIEGQLASARADADRYALRLRAGTASPAATGADRGGGGTTGVPGPADAAGGAPGARPAAELDDGRICAANTVLAEGWPRWWAEVSAAPR